MSRFGFSSSVTGDSAGQTSTRAALKKLLIGYTGLGSASGAATAAGGGVVLFACLTLGVRLRATSYPGDRRDSVP